MCLVSGSGVFWVNGRYLFSEDNNLRRRGFLDTFPKDWRTDSYYGLWLVVEWVGVIICILAMVRLPLDTIHVYTCDHTAYFSPPDSLHGAYTILHSILQEE